MAVTDKRVNIHINGKQAETGMLLEIKAEKVDEFTSKNDWMNRGQKVFSERPFDEEWKCFDKNGNHAIIGRDFTIAELHNTFPIGVYRLERISRKQLRIDEEAKKAYRPLDEIRTDEEAEKANSQQLKANSPAK